MRLLISSWPVLLPYALFFVLTCGSLLGFTLMQRRLKELHSKLASNEKEMRSATATWVNSVTALGKQVESIEEATRHPASGTDANAATRRKVLKLHRLGNSAEHIASEMRLAKGEVELLLKVHTIILQPQESLSSNRRPVTLEQKV